jgi:hypothetical protein
LSKKKINFRKIVANSLEMFFASLLGFLTADAIMGLTAPIEVFVAAALVPAFIQFAFTFCHEWGKAEPGDCSNSSVKNVASRIISLKPKFSNWVFFE